VTARTTTFVEIGPVVLLSPRATAAVLPFPEDVRMGWGLDVYWSGMRDTLRLGVVDATPMRHVGAVAADYGDCAERAIQERYLAQAGAKDVRELARVVGEPWRPWQATPPWL
jgi:hypothetical protein